MMNNLRYFWANCSTPFRTAVCASPIDVSIDGRSVEEPADFKLGDEHAVGVEFFLDLSTWLVEDAGGDDYKQASREGSSSLFFFFFLDLRRTPTAHDLLPVLKVEIYGKWLWVRAFLVCAPC